MLSSLKMAALCAGNYGLTQQHSGSSGAGDNKELIFVKLTDSALRAIEEFQRNQLKLGGSLNPSIQFVNGQGHLSFPSHNGNNVQKFSFSLADIEGGGTLECVQQTTGQPLQNIGHIQHKMRIHANDDVYETTRHRMAAAEETKKDKCTREIKPNQTDIGRKVKLKNPTTRISNIPPSSNSVLSKRDSSNNTYNNHSSSTTNNNHISNSSSNNNNSSSGAGVINNNSNSSLSVASANNNHNSSSNNNNNHNSNHLLSNGNSHSNHVANNVINHNNNNNSSSYNNLSTSPKLAAAAKSNGLQQQHNNHLHHNNNNNNHSVNNQSSGVTLQQQQHKPGYQPTVHDPPYQQSQQKSENGSARGTNGRTQHGKPEIMKRNIRERLIHLLALRPYKKPELYAKLAQDGIRGQEKNCIAQALKAIASMRDNVYYLHRHMWNDVQEDWPFYSEQDRQTLKRRKPQNLTPPLSSDGGSSTSGQSPSSAHNGSSPPSGSKRPSIAGDEGGAAGAMPTAKKPRISHYKKDILPDINRSNVTPNAQESEDSGVSLSYSLVPNDVAKRIQHSAGDVMVADTLVISDRDNYDDQISAYREETKKVKSLKDDFSDQFTRITTVEQRRKYKTEFDNDFQEYRRLHEIVERVSRKFAQLEEDLQHQRNNERRYKEIQRQIIKEYDESIKDNRFQETKQRFNYLHSKLSHIKHLVHDYDVAITNGLCRPQENY